MYAYFEEFVQNHSSQIYASQYALVNQRHFVHKQTQCLNNLSPIQGSNYTKATDANILYTL